jgi:hypothetical protein
VVVDPDGSEQWWVDGKLHRLDGPALNYANGTQEWWVDGKLHRLDGPAFIWADGRQVWVVNDQYHRTDGPAVIRADGTHEWWVDGKHITVQVEIWMWQQKITWPWNEEIQTQFVLTFL